MRNLEVLRSLKPDKVLHPSSPLAPLVCVGFCQLQEKLSQSNLGVRSACTLGSAVYFELEVFPCSLPVMKT